MADIEELDENALFDQAVGDEPADPPEPEPQPEPPEAQPEPEAQLIAGEPKSPVDDNAPQVPSWRVREINEERRTAIAERDALRAERAQWQARQQTTEQPKPAEKPPRPDPLLDPEGYAAAIREEVRQENLNERREESLLRAREANEKDFDEAYAAAQKAVDPALKARMQNSRDPGKTLLEWHRENKVKAEVGADPNAWLEKKLEERLKDPAFLAKAVELARGSAHPLTNGRPNIDMGGAKPLLSPSLNGASRSNALLRPGNDDISDEQLFAETTG